MLDELHYCNFCVIDAWKLRAWFNVKRISETKWQQIVGNVRDELAERDQDDENSRVLAFYDKEKSSRVILLKWGAFDLAAPGASRNATTQVRAWIEELF